MHGVHARGAERAKRHAPRHGKPNRPGIPIKHPRSALVAGCRQRRGVRRVSILCGRRLCPRCSRSAMRAGRGSPADRWTARGPAQRRSLSARRTGWPTLVKTGHRRLPSAGDCSGDPPLRDRSRCSAGARSAGLGCVNEPSRKNSVWVWPLIESP